MSKTAETAKPAAKKKNDTIYVNDPDGKKFYEMVGHDAQTLQPGDLIPFKGALALVKDVKKKHQRGGVDHTVILDSGYQFDPRADVNYLIGQSADGNLRSIRYWRPRAGF